MLARSLHFLYGLLLTNDWGHRCPLTLEVLFCRKTEVSLFSPQTWANDKQLSNDSIDQGYKPEGEFR